MAMSVKEARKEVARLIWDQFRLHRANLPKKSIVLFLRRQGLDYETVCREYPGVPGMQIHSLPSQEEVLSLSFSGVVSIKEGRELFAPFPSFIRKAAAAFISRPHFFNSSVRVELTFEDFALHWEREADARLACEVLLHDGYGSPLKPSGNPSAPVFLPDIDLLRYEHVATIEEVLSPPVPRNYARLNGKPTGQFQELLDAIQRHMLIHREWPQCVPFAVEHRRLGFLPGLVEAIGSDLVESFGYHEVSRLLLGDEAIRFLRFAPDDEQDLARTVNALIELWEETPGRQQITLRTIAEHVQRPVASLARLAPFLDGEDWLQANGHVGERWAATVLDVKAARIKPVTSWAHYLEQRASLARDSATYYDRFLQPSGEMEFSPELSADIGEQSEADQPAPRPNDWLSRFARLALPSTNPQARGRELELLVHDVLAAEGLAPERNVANPGEEIDLVFTLDGAHYLLECKWEREPFGTPQLRNFQGKVGSKAEGTFGVVLSMSGFVKDINAKATTGNRLSCIGITGEQFLRILEGRTSWKESVQRARRQASARPVFVMEDDGQAPGPTTGVSKRRSSLPK